jgi:hypothetical protein
LNRSLRDKFQIVNIFRLFGYKGRDCLTMT